MGDQRDDGMVASSWGIAVRGIEFAAMRTVAILIAIVVAAGVFGCEKPLFPPNMPRTQFERYQILHGEYRQPTETNAFGGQEPALRERLRPLAQQ